MPRNLEVSSCSLRQLWVISSTKTQMLLRSWCSGSSWCIFRCHHNRGILNSRVHPEKLGCSLTKQIRVTFSPGEECSWLFYRNFDIRGIHAGFSQWHTRVLSSGLGELMMHAPSLLVAAIDVCIEILRTIAIIGGAAVESASVMIQYMIQSLQTFLFQWIQMLQTYMLSWMNT